MRTAALAVLALCLAAACGPEPLGPREASSSGQERGPAGEPRDPPADPPADDVTAVPADDGPDAG